MLFHLWDRVFFPRDHLADFVLVAGEMSFLKNVNFMILQIAYFSESPFLDRVECAI